MQHGIDRRRQKRRWSRSSRSLSITIIAGSNVPVVQEGLLGRVPQRKGMEELPRRYSRDVFPFPELVERSERSTTPTMSPLLPGLLRKAKAPFSSSSAVSLSLRTKDETTDKAMERLMKRARTPEELLPIPTEEMEKIIYPVGFYRNKARLIQGHCRRPSSKSTIGTVPDTIEELLTIQGYRKKDGQHRRNRRLRQGGHSGGHARSPHIEQARRGQHQNAKPDRRSPANDSSPRILEDLQSPPRDPRPQDMHPSLAVLQPLPGLPFL